MFLLFLASYSLIIGSDSLLPIAYKDFFATGKILLTKIWCLFSLFSPLFPHSKSFPMGADRTQLWQNLQNLDTMTSNSMRPGFDQRLFIISDWLHPILLTKYKRTKCHLFVSWTNFFRTMQWISFFQVWTAVLLVV